MGNTPIMDWARAHYGKEYAPNMDAIDYIITHELCHIAVPHHGPEFFELPDRVLPDWPRRKHQLEQRMA